MTGPYLPTSGMPAVAAPIGPGKPLPHIGRFEDGITGIRVAMLLGVVAVIEGTLFGGCRTFGSAKDLRCSWPRA